MYGGLLPGHRLPRLRRRAARAPILLLTAVAVILPFHFIGHKEYRFLVPSVPLLVLLMGLGAADLLDACRRRRSTSRTAALVVCRLAGGRHCDQLRRLLPRRTGSRIAITSSRFARSARSRTRAASRSWASAGGTRPATRGCGATSRCTRPARDERRWPGSRPAANYVLTGPKSPAPPAPYVHWQEYSRPVEFLYRRPGGCVLDEPARVRPASADGSHRMKEVGRTAVRTLCKSRRRTASGPEGSSAK